MGVVTELIREPRDWHRDLHAVSDLGRWLIDTGRILTLTELQDYYEQPVKWNPEHQEFLRDEELGRLHDEQMALEDLERRSAL